MLKAMFDLFLLLVIHVHHRCLLLPVQLGLSMQHADVDGDDGYHSQKCGYHCDDGDDCCSM